MEQLQFKLTKYEGPLDVLLDLINKHKLNIHDIEISILLEQYINYIADLHALNLEVATEFLIMAARLIYIKTMSLLPKAEETEKLKRELQGQLLEYQYCKIIATQMREMYRGSDVFVRKPIELEFSAEDSHYKRRHNPRELLEAYMIALGRGRRKLPPSTTAFNQIVSKKKVDIKVGKLNVLQKLLIEGRVLYVEFFEAEERSEKLAVFLAMLDLLKGNRIVVSDDGEYIEFNNKYKREEKDISAEDLAQLFNEESGFDADNNYGDVTDYDYVEPQYIDPQTDFPQEYESTQEYEGLEDTDGVEDMGDIESLGDADSVEEMGDIEGLEDTGYVENMGDIEGLEDTGYVEDVGDTDGLEDSDDFRGMGDSYD